MIVFLLLSGDLTALGNINSLHSLLGAGPLLLPQGPPLNQTPLNPLTCLQLTMTPALMGEKPASLHHTSPPSQDELPAAQISQNALLHTAGQQREGSGSGLFDPYGSFMDTIYTSFLQVSERDSDSTPLSYPELPPALSPRRACSVHNPDLTRLGMDSAQSPARGTPKLSEEPSTAPPCRPLGADALSDIMEEAKTDGSTVCYSNGIGSGAGGRADRDEEEDEADEDEEEGRRTQGCLSPPVDDISSREAEQVRTEDLHAGARRGRKRKQTLQRSPDLPGGIDSIIEEPAATIPSSRPARSTRGKRRRVVR
ncbi:uncharacterized protein LOC120491731 [Pimephales promelas]|uniref:uncharacterized protein LOC120491731 n=1 Tax=Pimephales promelas TaxID=90988 RepID=UPI001955813E|nr:uncharacterized protein LOC120491731 [Pimephales promelas]